MAKKKKGLFTRLIEGPERSEDYARKTLPKNRWSLFWDLFKNNTGKIVKINLLTFLFLFPVFALLYLRTLLIDVQAINASFSQNVGIGYPAKPLMFMVGVQESIVFNADATFFIILFIHYLIPRLLANVGFFITLYVSNAFNVNKL